MMLKLDERFPLLWRDPSSLQLGSTPAAVRLERLTPVQERMIAALVRGTTAGGLLALAGADEAARDDLLQRLAGVLEPAEPAPTPAVAVLGAGPAARLTASALGGAGIRALVAERLDPEARGGGGAAATIVIGHFVLPPALQRRLLQLELAHLPVLFDETGVEIGPLVQPGLGPCLRCCELARRDDDPARPALAAQLLERSTGTESPLLAAEAAAAAVRSVQSLLRGERQEPVSVRIAADTGGRSTNRHHPHPECGCLGLAELPLSDLTAAAR